MATPPIVLRIPIAGSDDDFFVLEVSPNGSKPLDLKLLGTEGAAVFIAKLRHRRIAEHKASTGHCTDAAWESILTSIFVDHKPVHDIEIKADVQDDGSAVSVSFRKNIQGITQRLGSIKLPARPENDDDEANDISPFHWCVSILGERARLQDQVGSSSSKIEALEDTVAQLKDQLQELIRAKEDDEALLLEKFRDLLNEKKVKIRQQQRLLASVDIDEYVRAVIQPSGPRKPKTSRPAKRKAYRGNSASNDDDGDEEEQEDQAAGDVMDVDDSNGPQLDPEPDERMTTDDETQDEASTQSDDDDEDDQSPPQTSSKSRTARQTTRKQAAAKPPLRRLSRSGDASAKDVKPAPALQKAAIDDDVAPARRELPFMRNKQKPAAPAPKPAQGKGNDDDDDGHDDDDATESDDDEL